ncbi:hypothetical protein CfE428DRAFT_0682 [Chthoniobacter flavus Ellin428]|uniref:Uncharacterized protein n=1 Tax=Chthoniobacter flavus Ellin428 TaxID=497964 RepID=B4CVJ5_9BACT|nr:hypothetical protein CfE428DRAFT_0682 [Chthoniobacter flavus Ellin428]
MARISRPCAPRREKGQRRRFAQHDPRAQVFGSGGNEFTILPQHGAGFGAGVDDQSGEHLGPDRMQGKFELSDDTEISTAAAQGPEQVRVGTGSGVQRATVRRDNPRRDEIVRGEAVFAAEPAETAAQGEAGNARRGIDPRGRGEAVHLRGAIHVGQRAAWLHRRAASAGIDPHTLHRRKVDHQPVFADRETGDVVSSAPDRNLEPIFAGIIHRLHDVGLSPATDDGGGSAVDHAVPNGASLVVSEVSGKEDVAAETLVQGFEVLQGGCSHVVVSVFFV